MKSKINRNYSKFTMTNYFSQPPKKVHYSVYRKTLVEKIKELDLMICLGPTLNSEDIKLMNQLLNRIRDHTSRD